MIVYAESSAVLAWLLEEPPGAAMADALAGADRVVASTLTVIETRRALSRGQRAGRLAAADERALERMFLGTVEHWTLLELGEAVLERAAAPFPIEPVRTLDALHLASAELLRPALGRLGMLSLDQRVRANAAAMGIDLL